MQCSADGGHFNPNVVDDPACVALAVLSNRGQAHDTRQERTSCWDSRPVSMFPVI
jgi:hypothetical protein